MKTPTPALIEYLSTQAKIMSKTRAPSADMMLEAAERMQDMFDMLQERCFYASEKSFKRSGYSLTVDWETAYRDIEYRDAPLYPTSEEAVEAELLQRQVARMYASAEYQDSQFRNDDPVGNWQKFREGWKYRILKTDNGPKVETVLESPPQ